MKLRAWGADGLLGGNEGRLFSVMPALYKSDGLWFASFEGWTIDELRGPLSHTEADQQLIRFDREIDIAEGDIVIIAGPALLSDINALEPGRIGTPTLDMIPQWPDVKGGFRAVAGRSRLLRQLRQELASLSSSAFNDALLAREAETVDNRAIRAFRLSQRNPAVSEEERLIQSGLISIISRDMPRYERVLTEAEVRGTSRKKFEARLQDRLTGLRKIGRFEAKASSNHALSRAFRVLKAPLRKLRRSRIAVRIAVRHTPREPSRVPPRVFLSSRLQPRNLQAVKQVMGRIQAIELDLAQLRTSIEEPRFHARALDPHEIGDNLSWIGEDVVESAKAATDDDVEYGSTSALGR